MGGFQGTGLVSARTIQKNESVGVSSTGILFTYPSNGINSVRVQISDAAPSNVVAVSGSVDGVNWIPVGSVTGNNAVIFSTHAYDFIQAETVVYGGSPFNASWKLEASPSAFSITDKDGDIAEITDGKIHVLAEIVDDLPGGSTQVIESLFDSVSSVAAGPTVTIISYTVPALSTFRLYSVEFGGSNIGTYELRFNGVLQAKKRTWFNGELSGTFEFLPPSKDGIELAAGTIITVRVNHNRPNVGDFEARIFGLLVLP